MPVVKDLVAHILRHVNAEAAESDPSQVAGVDKRAQYVRDALRGFALDQRELPLDTALQFVAGGAPTSPEQDSFKRVLGNIRDEVMRPQSAIQTWVGKNQERPGG